MRPTISGRLYGQKYNLYHQAPRCGSAGECIKKKAHFVLRVNPLLDEKKHLDTTIHELLHAADWKADEEYVYDVAREIARVLHALGYRRQA